VQEALEMVGQQENMVAEVMQHTQQAILQLEGWALFALFTPVLLVNSHQLVLALLNFNLKKQNELIYSN
jgi:hypothetical protein